MSDKLTISLFKLIKNHTGMTLKEGEFSLTGERPFWFRIPPFSLNPSSRDRLRDLFQDNFDVTVVYYVDDYQIIFSQIEPTTSRRIKRVRNILDVLEREYGRNCLRPETGRILSGYYSTHKDRIEQEELAYNKKILNEALRRR